MRQLILFRHAKAEGRSASGDDFDRQLTQKGEADARLIGQVLHEAGLDPDLALVSAAMRTRQTWEAAAAAFPGSPEVRHEAGLYNASSAWLRQSVESLEGHGGVVMFVGHNPGMHQLALDLLVESGAAASLIARAGSRFPPATAAVFAMDAAGRPTYDGLFYAADFGGGAGD